MGVHGLWHYLSDHGLCSAPSGGQGDAPILAADHLLFDMNAVVHSVIRGSAFTSRKTIGEVAAAVRRLMQRFPPRKTLVLVFDGAAPVAKLKVQKERRASMPSPQRPLEPPPAATSARYNYDYEGTEVPLVREEVVAGSEFLLACEDALRKSLVPGDGGRVPAGVPAGCAVVVSGCEDAGEGELKISSILRALWLEQRRKEAYTGDDVIVVVGNDSDLALVGIACTPYSHYYMVDPADCTITAIAELYAHWRKGAANGLLPLELLPSYRIDFVFLKLLSGGDWYEGIAGGSKHLWRRYRELRGNGGYFRRSLIRGEDFTVDVEFLRAVMNVKASPHHALRQSKIKQATQRGGACLSQGAVENGVELLKGAMWALKSILLGQCFDYDFRVFTKAPTLGMLRAASGVKRVAERIRPSSTAPLPLFSPLEQCLAVMGNRGRYSAELLRALATACPDGGERLTRSQSVSYLKSEVRRLMGAVDRDKLTAGERGLLQLRHADFLNGGCVLQGTVTCMSHTYGPASCS
ncbi:uncharacterized protein Tco025E_07006 [Trypanosoma conorhini]|uniref:Xrn1 N-terminal domain-containing protein n=1 Tax=Trypanosoma conorhini TaxID=83891 RepID=A0A422NV84_9TRYP|nr:uncharacterized protein Tco025E_07006 [Trypanosoma conorhini]RNF09381.1 hypothetical protein Tco025E_07006 [Trypanosoma conorhini]